MAGRRKCIDCKFIEKREGGQPICHQTINGPLWNPFEDNDCVWWRREDETRYLKGCYSCGEDNFWQNKWGGRVCRVCHPPAEGAELIV